MCIYMRGCRRRDAGVAMENDEEKALKKQYFILLFLLLDIGASLSLDDELRYWPTCSVGNSSRIMAFVSRVR